MCAYARRHLMWKSGLAQEVAISVMSTSDSTGDGRTTRAPGSPISRREFLEGGVALSGAMALGRRLAPSRWTSTVRRALAVPRAGSDLGAIEHVVFLMQENRSFDHYFGSYKGVRGFDDHTASSLGAFAQPFAANTTRPPMGVQLPFHFDTTTGFDARTRDLSHDWLAEHLSRNDGKMDAFVKTHMMPSIDGPSYGLFTMGYYTREDLPYHYALADAFTICDHYFCSILGPTDPNRLMALSGTIDPDGLHGGPVLTTSSSAASIFSVDWVTVPELLEDAGVSWKTYTVPGNGYNPSNPNAGSGDATLQYFSQYSNPSSTLYQKAFLPTFPNDFVDDIQSGNLPSVSWIIPPFGFDEHPPAASGPGAWFIDQILQALVSNPSVWSKTVFFVMYDENDGFFDHVAPPVAPPGTPGEYVTVRPLPGAAQGVDGPVGLGFRVPMLVLSPFSTGGYVSSQTFDHTSQIRFLEERFGILATNISTWRRQNVGDLTSTLQMGSPNTSVPSLPATSQYSPQVTTVEGTTTTETASQSDGTLYELAPSQVMPQQESGSVKRLPNSAPRTEFTIGPFGENSIGLNDELRTLILAAARQLVAQDVRKVNVFGFTDASPATLAMRQSRERAQAVSAYLRSCLAKLRFPEVAITSTGKGSASPVASNATAAGRALNRRVLIVI